MAESEPTMVTAERLHEIWMLPEAIGMTDDHQRGIRVVHMEDGSEYAATFGSVLSEHAALAQPAVADGGDEAGGRVVGHPADPTDGPALPPAIVRRRRPRRGPC